MQVNALNVDLAATDDLLRRLRGDLEREIASYKYNHPECAMGSPLSAETIANYLDSMRQCLVEPRLEEATIGGSMGQTGVKRMCVTMAEENNYVLIFDFVGEEYHLAWRSSNGLATWGIEGDAVGCFIAR